MLLNVPSRPRPAAPLESHLLPRLVLRGPTVGLWHDVNRIREYRDALVAPSGTEEPTVLALNLEGRFPTPGVLTELVIPLAKAANSRRFGPIILVICTPDEATRTVLRALAETSNVTFYVAHSSKDLSAAEPVGSLTQSDFDTLDILRRLGGRATVSAFSSMSGLAASAATNRLVGVLNKGLIERVDRPRDRGNLFLDPRAAIPSEEPADPTSTDFAVPEAVRRDVAALMRAQVDEPEIVVEAWKEFLTKHRDYLSEEHKVIADSITHGDHEAISETGRRYARKQANARRRADLET